MEFCNYRFVQIGHFHKSDKPLDVIYNGKADTVSVELKLDCDEYRDIGESVYLVVVNGTVKYVGEYSKSLSDRWIKRKSDNYIWHHQDVNIIEALNGGNEVTLYLLDNPYVIHTNGHELNVSKAIEHDILQRISSAQVLWNKRNTVQNNKPFLRLASLLENS